MEIVMSGLLPLLFGSIIWLLGQLPAVMQSVGPSSSAIYLELIFGAIFAVYMAVRAFSLSAAPVYTRDSRSRHSALK